jgi:hypothetical protein
MITGIRLALTADVGSPSVVDDPHRRRYLTLPVMLLLAFAFGSKANRQLSA